MVACQWNTKGNKNKDTTCETIIKYGGNIPKQQLYFNNNINEN